MTIATDKGFKIGELYRVVKEQQDWYIAPDMVVRFIEDDSSDCPWFGYVSGPKGCDTDSRGELAIGLEHLVPVEPTKASINKSLLLLYIQQQYPDDRVLKALVESV